MSHTVLDRVPWAAADETPIDEQTQARNSPPALTFKYAQSSPTELSPGSPEAQLWNAPSRGVQCRASSMLPITVPSVNTHSPSVVDTLLPQPGAPGQWSFTAS